MAKVRVVAGDNRTGYVEEEKLATARAQGWVPATEEEAAAKKARREASGVGGTVQGTGEALVRGASFGLSDPLLKSMGVEGLDVRREALGEAGAIAELAGSVAPALLTGGATTGANLALRGGGALRVAARLTPAGRVAQTGAAISEATATALGGGRLARVAGGVTSGGFEGALAGMGSEVSQAALGDVDLTAERLLAGAKGGGTLGALFGGGTVGLGLGLEHAYTGARKVSSSLVDNVLGGVQHVDGPGSKTDSLLGAASERQVRALGGGDEHVLAARRSLERTRTAEGRRLAEIAASGGRGIGDEIGARLKTTLGDAGAGDTVRAWGSKIRASDGGKAMLAKRATETADALKGLQGPNGSKLRQILRAEGRGIDSIEAYTRGRMRVSKVLQTMRDEGDDGLARAQSTVADYLAAGDDTAIWGPSIKAREAVKTAQQAEKAALDALPPKARAALTGGEIDDATARALGGKHLDAVQTVLGARSSIADALEGVGEDVSKLRRSLDEVKGAIGYGDKVRAAADDLRLLDELEGGTGATYRSVLETGGEIVGAFAGGLSFGGGVLGRAGGKLAGLATRPASTVRVIARVRGGLDAIKARQGAAVQAFAALSDAGARGAAAGARGAAKAVRRVSMTEARREAQGRRAALVSTIARIGALSRDPEAVAASMAPAVEHLTEAAPDVSGAIVAGASRAVQYLAAVAPPVYRPAYSPGTAMIDPVAAERFSRQLDAVRDPDGTIALLGRGALTLDHAQAIKAVYPRRFEELRQQITDVIGERIAEGRPVSFAARMQLGAIGELLTDETLRPDVFASIQASMGPAAQPPPSVEGAAVAQQPADITPPQSWAQRLEAGG